MPPPARPTPEEAVPSARPPFKASDWPLLMPKIVVVFMLTGAEMMCEPEVTETIGALLPLEAKVRLPPLPGPIEI